MATTIHPPEPPGPQKRARRRLTARLWARGETLARTILARRVGALLVILAAIIAGFYTPFLGIIVLGALVTAGLVVGGRSQLAVVATWVFALLTIWPRNTIGPFAVTPATALALVAAGLFVSGRISPGHGVPPRLGKVGHAVLALFWVFALTYALGMAEPLVGAQKANADKRMMLLVGGVGIALLTCDAVRSRTALRRLLAGVLGASGIMALFAVLQFVADIDLRQTLTLPGFTSAGVRATEEVERFGLLRASGTASHPIELSTTAAMLLPLALHFGTFAPTGRARRAATTIAMLLAVAIGTSISRSGLLALGLVLLIMLPSWTPQRRFRVYAGTAIFVGIASFAMPQMIEAAISVTTDWQGDTEGGGASNLEARTERYGIVRELVTERPLLGRGYGTFDSTVFFATDNQYLTMLVEVGVIGTATFLAVLGIAIGRLRKIRRRTRSPADADLARALIASVVAIGVTLATYDGLAFHFTHGMLFLLLGVVAVLDRLVPEFKPVALSVLPSGAVDDDVLQGGPYALALPTADPAPAAHVSAGPLEPPAEPAVPEDAGAPGAPDDDFDALEAARDGEAASTNRSAAVVSGARWGVVTQVTTQVSRFVISVVLARLLAPAEFGIVTLGLTFMLFLDVFKDMGTTAAVVQRERVSTTLLSTLFWINAGVGLALTFMMAAASPFLSGLADGGDEGARLLAVLGISTFLSSLRLVQEGIIRRRFRYRRLAAINLSLTVVQGVVSVVAAALGAGAWALVIGLLAGTAVSTVQAWLGTAWRPSFRFRWSEARSVANFSVNLTFFNLFNFFFLHSDKFLVGRFLGASALGIYGLGQRILMGPTRSISQMIQQVLFPTFARLQDDHAAMGRGYLRACAAIALVTFPTLCGLAVVAGPFVEVVLGPKWLDGVTLVTILAPVGAMHSLHFTVGAIYTATGRTDLLFRWGVASGVLTVAGYIIGLQWGLNGVAAAYAVVVAILTYPAFAVPFRLIGLRTRSLVGAVLPALGGTVLTCAAAGSVRWALESADAAPALVLVTASGAGAVVYLGYLALTKPPALRDLAQVARRGGSKGGRASNPSSAPFAISPEKEPVSDTAAPQITAVVPTYNREALIGRAIESMLSQTHPPDEIIVVDDGSSDRTEAIVAGYPEVRYIRQQNAGASAARNRGVENASHEWIAFLDSDDIWLPDHLEKMVAAMTGTGCRASFYFADMLRTVVEGNERHWSRCNLAVQGPFELREDGIEWVLLPRQPTMLQASVISRAAYQRAGGLWPPLKVRHDNHIFIKMAAEGPVCAVNHVGTSMTADDVAENRLFQTIRPGWENYETETVLMYGDLLERLPKLDPRHRAILQERLKGGHFTLARIHLRSGRFTDAAIHAVKGTRAYPSSTLKSITNRLRR